MIQWAWTFRDFLRARRLAEGCLDRWPLLYRDVYLRPHREDLFPLHFIPKGFPDEASVLRRLRELGWRYFLPAVRVVDGERDFEGHVRSVGEEMVRALGVRGLHPLHVIFGLGLSPVHTQTLPAGDATVLCLEAAGGFHDIRLLLAHEIHHWARKEALRRDIFGTVAEKAAAEGLAAVFSEEAAPGGAPWSYAFVPESTYRYVVDHRGELRALLHAGHGNLVDILFARHPTALPLEGMPPRSGYAMGYLAAKEALRGRPARLVPGLPSREILEAL